MLKELASSLSNEYIYLIQIRTTYSTSGLCLTFWTSRAAATLAPVVRRLSKASQKLSSKLTEIFVEWQQSTI